MHYYIFNKPTGCVTARTDAVHRTVMDYFPEELAGVLHPVGRLDKDTCGMLILTDDGDLDFRIMQPSKHVSKTYFFYAIGTMTEEKKILLEGGVPMSGTVTRPAELQMERVWRIGDLEKFIPPDRRERYMKNPEGPAFSARLTIHEGKKHEVRRMLETAGCRIFYLRRESIGRLRLDESLAPGEYRPLTEAELEMLCDDR